MGRSNSDGSDPSANATGRRGLKFPEKVVDGGKVWFRRERTGVEAGADVGLKRIGERHDVVERPRPVADGEKPFALFALKPDNRLAVPHKVPSREQ